MKRMTRFILVFLPATGCLYQLHAQPTQWMEQKGVLFEENKGQVRDMQSRSVPDVLFRVWGGDAEIYLTKSGVSYVFREIDKKADEELCAEDEHHPVKWARVDMELSGADIGSAQVVKEDAASAWSNYYLANCPEGILNVKSYRKIIFKNVYPGIDWQWHVSQAEDVHQEFVVHPGADPDRIQWKYTWQKDVYINADGQLVLQGPIGEMTEGRPFCYEKNSGRNIQASYRATAPAEFAYAVGAYKSSETLVIDPVLMGMRIQWGTYFGAGNSSFNGVSSMSVDAAGNVYGLIGYQQNGSMPTLNPGGGAWFQGSAVDITNLGIQKFNNSGTLIWSTYYGGSGGDWGKYVANDAAGNLFITGWTQSSDFPMPAPTSTGQEGPFWASNVVTSPYTSCSGCVPPWSNPSNAQGGANDNLYAVSGAMPSGYASDYLIATGFGIAPVPAGYLFRGLEVQVEWMTSGNSVHDFSVLLTKGGMPIGYDRATNTAVGTSENIRSFGGPSDTWGISAADLLDPSFGVQIQVLNSGGGGTKTASVDRIKMIVHYAQWTNVFQPVIAGTESAFVLKFNSNGVRQWSTYYGGSGRSNGEAVVADAGGNVFVTGDAGDQLPLQTLAGAYNQTYPGNPCAFIAKFPGGGGAPTWATYYPNNSGGTCIAVAPNGNLVVAGEAGGGYGGNNILPTQALAGAYNNPVYGGVYNGFILEFNSACALRWATFFGGYENRIRGIAVDNGNNLYVTASSANTLPVVNLPGAYNQPVNAGSPDVGIAKFNSARALVWGTYYGGASADHPGPDYFTVAMTCKRRPIIATDRFGDLYIAGQAYSIPTYNPGSGFCYTTGSGDYIASFASSGALQWASYTGNAGGFACAIAVDPWNCVFSSGEWFGSGSIGLLNAGSGAYYDGTETSTNDGYFQKFCPDLFSPLPVEWLSFTGTNEGDKNLLEWKTASEINSSYFVVERSVNELDFESIGKIRAAGNSSTVRTYSFVDNWPVHGINYYRLKQVDADGQADHSGVIAIAVDVGSALSVYPLPAKEVLHISFGIGSESPATLLIYNAVGQLVEKYSLGTFKKGFYTHSIELANLPAGFYSIRLDLSDRTDRAGFVVDR